MIAATVGLRSHHWDRLRLIAIYDIVAFHMFYQWGLLGVGIPIFLLLTLALGGAGSGGTLAEFARKRFERLMVPWIFWSLVILALRLLRMALGARDDYWGWEMLLYGPWPHLWFLPFAFVASVLLAWISRRTPESSTGLSVVCGLFSAALMMLPMPETHREPFRQWFWSLPALPLGFALGKAIEKMGGPRAARDQAGVVCVVALVAYAVLHGVANADAQDALVRYSLSMALVTAALFLPDIADRFTISVAPLVLGIYLLHDPLYELALRRLQLERWIVFEPPQVILLMALTAALTWGLRRTRLARFV